MKELVLYLYAFDRTLSKIVVSHISSQNSPALISTKTTANDLTRDVNEFARQIFKSTTNCLIYYLPLKQSKQEIILQAVIISQSYEVDLPVDFSWLKTIDISTVNIPQYLNITDIISGNSEHRDDIHLLEISRINVALEKALRLILSSANMINGDFGWDHNLDVRNRLGIIGTSLSLLALSKYPIESLPYKTISDSIKTIVTKQHSSGGWGTRSMDFGNVPIVHSTAYAIWALSQFQLEGTFDSISKGVTWLKKAQKGGGWGIDRASSHQLITATTLALKALTSATNEKSKSIDLAIEWLLEACHPTGGWGAYSYRQSPSSSPSPAHTGRVICCLLDAGVSPDEKVIKDSSLWLLNQQTPAGTWESSSEAEYLSDQSFRLDFKHAGSQWAVMSLLSYGLGFDNRQVLRAVSRIIEKQDSSGGWGHEFASGHIPAWATADSIFALTLAGKKLPEYLISVRGFSSQEMIQNMTRIAESDDEFMKVGPGFSTRSLLAVGVFFLLIFLILIGASVWASVYVSPVAFPLILTFVLVSFIVLIVTVYRGLGQISTEEFSELVQNALSFWKKKS